MTPYRVYIQMKLLLPILIVDLKNMVVKYKETLRCSAFKFSIYPINSAEIVRVALSNLQLSGQWPNRPAHFSFQLSREGFVKVLRVRPCLRRLCRRPMTPVSGGEGVFCQYYFFFNFTFRCISLHTLFREFRLSENPDSTS